MPVGLYTRKGAKGRRMYFRDGKLISKKSYDMSKSRRSTRKGMRRKTARRAYTGKRSRRRNMARRRMAIPHPSITGMASGLAIATYLNKGTTAGGGQSPGVLKKLADSKFSGALEQVSQNAINLATSEGGRKVLTSSVALAAAGGVVRKWFPTLKVGGTKFFFRA